MYKNRYGKEFVPEIIHTTAHPIFGSICSVFRSAHMFWKTLVMVSDFLAIISIYITRSFKHSALAVGMKNSTNWEKRHSAVCHVHMPASPISARHVACASVFDKREVCLWASWGVLGVKNAIFHNFVFSACGGSGCRLRRGGGCPGFDER